MKKNAHTFLQIKPFTTQLLLIIALASFSYFALAARRSPHITDDQIMRAARIAKATGTNITIIKETTTVTVHGGGKKRNKNVRQSVMGGMKQKKNGTEVDNSASDDVYQAPRLEEDPYVTNNRSPVQEESGLRPPVLE